MVTQIPGKAICIGQRHVSAWRSYSTISQLPFRTSSQVNGKVCSTKSLETRKRLVSVPERVSVSGKAGLERP